MISNFYPVFGQKTPLNSGIKRFGRLSDPFFGPKYCIALSPNLISSSKVPSHEVSESGPDSKIMFGTKKSFGQRSLYRLIILYLPFRWSLTATWGEWGFSPWILCSTLGYEAHLCREQSCQCRFYTALPSCGFQLLKRSRAKF